MIKEKLRSLLKRRPYSNPNIEIAANFVTGRNIEGDYFEFGVHTGRSFSYACRQLIDNRAAMLSHHRTSGLPVPENLRNDMRFFAFDSFEGLPPISGLDKSSKLPSHWQAGQYRSSEDAFLRTVRDAGIPLSQVSVVKGWYDDTLVPATKTKWQMTKGCIFHIDCDLYESTKLALEFISGLYVDGSVLIFDDWFGFKGNPGYGEQRAFAEWKEKHGIRASELNRFGGQSVAFIIHAD